MSQLYILLFIKTNLATFLKYIYSFKKSKKFVFSVRLKENNAV